MSIPPIASTTLMTPHRSATSTPSTGRPVSSITIDRTAPIPLTAPVPGQREGCLTVASTYISFSRPVRQPHFTASRAGPGGKGALIRFRGSPIIATLPVATSISTSIITSMRRLQRSMPASEPSSSRSKRPSLPQGVAPARVHGTVAPSPGSVPVPEPIGPRATGTGVAVGAGSAPSHALQPSWTSPGGTMNPPSELVGM